VTVGLCVGMFEDARASNLPVIDPKKAWGATISPVASTKPVTAKNGTVIAKYLILAIDYPTREPNLSALQLCCLALVKLGS